MKLLTFEAHCCDDVLRWLCQILSTVIKSCNNTLTWTNRLRTDVWKHGLRKQTPVLVEWFSLRETDISENTWPSWQQYIFHTALLNSCNI